ncbi:biogenesis of lysosome-related organelles complex 1 subunit 1 [Planococcus citri]|uniref:biogenesis of lysosome-related organelles complex 1 subunit 1 n=1 Tax=Planococcus citri TaxID=170843 RepID=UPI0031F8B594
MLTSLVKEHHAKQSARKEKQEAKRKEAIAAANDLTQALVEHLNLGVAQAYLNQKKIEEEVKQLHFNMAQFSKQTHQWVTLVDSFNGALKQIGDLENWSRIIEKDMTFIAESLEHAYKGLQE